MLPAAVRLDLLGHADAGIHPARHQARERAEVLEAFLVADDRQATQLRRRHPVELCAEAVGQVDEVGPFAAIEPRERACPRPEGRVEVAGVPERTGDEARAGGRPPAGKRREDVDGEPAVGIDAFFFLEERQDGSEPRAVEARDQVEDAGQRAADDAAGARLDEQDAACRHRIEARLRANAKTPARAVSSKTGQNEAPALLVPPRGALNQRVRMTTQAFAPRPTVCASATRAPGTWRGPAAPRSCQVSSTIWPRAEAPSGSPLARRPPEGLTGSRDAISPPPSRTPRPPPRFAHSPSSSAERISRAASVSCSSTTWRSPGPRPASA